MAVIKMALPGYVADLMTEKTPQQAYDGMIKNNGLPFREAVTFGMVITPIVTAEGAECAHVIYWHNKMVSVTHYTPGDEFHLLTWEEYVAERLNDGNFSYNERPFFDQVQIYFESASTAALFSPQWATAV